MYLEFFQTEKVEDKRHPLTLSLYFADKHGERISNENLLIADSISTEPSARTFLEKFVFRTKRYDENEQYFLILEEDATQTIYEKIPFTIDLSSKFH